MHSSGWNIVLVEDSLDLCESWADLLELEGHHVRFFLTGRQALASESDLRSADLLVTDFYLPDINGLAVIQSVRKVRPDLPVIMLTGSRDPTIHEQLLRLPRTVLLHKPARIEDFEVAAQRLFHSADASTPAHDVG